jgi:two-component system sensor histidine kinase YesM
MDAHFVVNTLQNIKYLADIGETEKSGRMAHGLAAILQHRHTGDELVNIFDDFQILENYIDIMNIKFDGKFQVEYEVDDRLEAYLIPGLILQPLAENALTHGLGNKEGAALLIVKGFIRDNRIVVEIADNGAGIAPAKLQALKESLAQADLGDFPRPGLHGVALGNIERRIRLRYGEGYGLALDSALSQGTTVTVTLPLVPDV